MGCKLYKQCTEKLQITLPLVISDILSTYILSRKPFITLHEHELSTHQKYYHAMQLSSWARNSVDTSFVAVVFRRSGYFFRGILIKRLGLFAVRKRNSFSNYYQCSAHFRCFRRATSNDEPKIVCPKWMCVVSWWYFRTKGQETLPSIVPDPLFVHSQNRF